MPRVLQITPKMNSLMTSERGQTRESIIMHNMVRIFVCKTKCKVVGWFSKPFHTMCCVSTIVLPVDIKQRHDQDNLQLHAGHAYLV